jgi:hypothetical protein
MGGQSGSICIHQIAYSYSLKQEWFLSRPPNGGCSCLIMQPLNACFCMQGGGDGPMRGLFLSLKAGGEACWGTKEKGSQRIADTHFQVSAFGQAPVLMEHVTALHNNDGMWFRLAWEFYDSRVSSYGEASLVYQGACMIYRGMGD